MKVLSLHLPDSLRAKVCELAEREDVSLNQFIALSVAEKDVSPADERVCEVAGRPRARD